MARENDERVFVMLRMRFSNGPQAPERNYPRA
jgi:hypothetical protein